MYLAISAGGDVGVVRHHHERGAASLLTDSKQVEHVLAVDRVEVAGGLVGKDDGRLEDEGAGERDTLLFSAGELDGVVMQAVGESDAGEKLAVARARPSPRR